MENHYMVELDLLADESFLQGDLEVEINALINYFRNSGKMVSMGLSLDDAVMWLVLKSENEEELVELIFNIPSKHEISFDYYLLNHFEIIQEIGSFSLN